MPAAGLSVRVSQSMRESLRAPYPVLTKRLTGPDLDAPIIRCSGLNEYACIHDLQHKGHVRRVGGGQLVSEGHAVGRTEDEQLDPVDGE